MRGAVFVAAAVVLACGGPAQQASPDAGSPDGGAPAAPLHSGTLAASLTRFAPYLDGVLTLAVQPDGTIGGRFVPADGSQPNRSAVGSATGTDIRIDLLLSDPRFGSATDWHVSGNGTTTGIVGSVAFDSRTDAASQFVAVYQ